MRTWITNVAVLIVACCCNSLQAAEGGYKDPNTGKVWSANLYTLSGGAMYGWSSATQFAADHQIWDYNAQNQLTLYSDWRLPTLAELQTACGNGTMSALASLYFGPGFTGTWPFWSSTTKGSGKNTRAYFLLISFQNGVVVRTETRLPYPNEVGVCDAFMIRP